MIRICLLLILTFPAGGFVARASESLSDRLHAIVDGVKGATRVGVMVVDADSGAPLFERDVQGAFKPASVLKIFTTSAALTRFGPDFAYETRCFVRGDELWVVGSGDPALGDERLAEKYGRTPDALLREWVSAGRAQVGAGRITKIVLDDTVFDDQPRHALWPREQHMAWYQAPVGALNYNDNCLDSVARLRDGGVTLALRPPLPAELVRNEMKSGKTHRPVVRRDAESDIFEFKGTLAKGGALEAVAANRPTLFFGYALKQALETDGLGADIAVVRRTLSPADCSNAKQIALVRTPLRDVIWRANTFSQNLFAECLCKSLEAYAPDGKRTGRPGSWTGGAAMLKSTLAKIGVDLSSAEIVDGSGLSHANAITPLQAVQLLVAMKRHRHGDVFVDSLADAGEEGTMKNRFRDAALVGRMRGKTGTIQNVHTFAGYIDRRDGRTLAFAVLVNGPGGADLPVRIAKALAD